MNRNRLISAKRVHLFVGLAFHAHGSDIDLDGACDAVADLFDVLRQLRPLGNDDGIEIHDDESGPARNARGRAQQMDAVCVFPANIGVWKMPADVAFRGGAKNGVSERVTQHVRV